MTNVLTQGGGVSAASAQPEKEVSLAVLLRRVICLTFVVSVVEVTTYVDVGGIYPGIMTGNTVQLGRAVALHHWANAGSIGTAIGLFFLGCIGASLIKRFLSWPYWGLLIMAAILAVVSFIRLVPDLRLSVELPLIALALGIQGETLAKFGGVSLQTIVVTNNIVKFSEAFTGRYLLKWFSLVRPTDKRPALKEVALPACSWVTYVLSAMVGATIGQVSSLGLLLPVVVLVLTVIDLHRDL
ncbi:YoaK family protein [Asaia sp. VD9]|uniref:YoaK family protein n=1 Tax=Asaia sp. VD9 TaxID=3081235 RepID=UPI00301B29A2